MTTYKDIKAFLDDTLLSVKQPIQYVGNEIHVVHKNWESSHCKLCLIYPDRYEIGMSNLAVQIFYDRINNNTNHLLERAFIPAEDMTTAMKTAEIPLFSLESHQPMSHFDAIAFSISTELSYTNVLLAMDLANIALHNQDRLNDQAPIVIAGGGGVANPMPMSGFIDVFSLGDGEDCLEQICDIIYKAKLSGKTKSAILNQLNQLEFTYVPYFHTNKTVKRSIFMDFKSDIGISKPVIPLLKVVHNRFSVEIMRGCPRKCRFCQASWISKPVRKRPLNILEAQIKNLISNSGYGEISLSSLSASDYKNIAQLLENLDVLCTNQNVALSFPSLRIDTISNNFAFFAQKIRQTGMTLAPEAGSQFLRDVIDKSISEAEIMEAMILASQHTPKALKLYFMIGLPREEQQDIDELINLAFRIIDTIRPRKNKIVINVSNFVPKPFTPFQWLAPDSYESLKQKLQRFKKELRHPQLELRWTDPEVSLLEATLSRGNSETGELIEKAYNLGASFDAWFDKFSWETWQKAAAQLGTSMEILSQKTFEIQEELPWGFIRTGLSAGFLERELEKSLLVTRTSE